MKTIIINFSSILVIYFAVCGTNVLAQSSKDINFYFTSLPKDLKLKESTPQKYLMVTDYYNRDFYGNFINKSRVQGEYTRALKSGFVQWNNATIANSASEHEEFGVGQPIPYMENFKYQTSEKILDPSFFASFPNDPSSMLTKNLVWDMAGFEAFAWMCFDSLKFNEVYDAKSINGEADLAGVGTFTNRDIKLTWLGVSKVNNEICALIEFRTFNNPLKVEMPGFNLKGRSHYWGYVWVSLTDKQIEQAKLFEDVTMDMKMGNNSPNLLNAVREISLTKLN